MSRVLRIFIYPIKSCRGVEVEAAALTPRGLAFDRRYMLVDPEGRFLSQRRHPKMALIEVSIGENAITVDLPGREPLRVPHGLGEGPHESCKVRLWDDTVEATLAAADVNIRFSEFMGFACGLAWLADHQHRAVPNTAAAFDDEVGFADAAPVLLISDASLASLNRRLATPVGIERFRPNLVVSADEAHAEDEWRSVVIGDASLEVAWPCSRCVLITRDPLTGERHPEGEPMRTLTTYRQHDRSVHFGQNLLPRSMGTIHVGDECVIDEIIGT